jgi:hypothetical protein
MVLMAENDRENAGQSSIGASIPISEGPVDGSSRELSDGASGELDLGEDQLDPTDTPAPSVQSTAAAPTAKNRGPATPGVLDPTLLAPDVVASVFSIGDGIAVSFMDIENDDIAGVRYEIRVVSAKGVKIRNTAKSTVFIKGISKTRCSVEVRTLLDGRHSNPIVIRCGK